MVKYDFLYKTFWPAKNLKFLVFFTGKKKLILLLFLACMAIRLILIRLILAALIACMGNFRGDPPRPEPAYAENRVVNS